MKEEIITNLKNIYKPQGIYHGEWNLESTLEDNALFKKDKNLFNAFLERYYYMPLKVIFKDEELVYGFKYNICSKIGNNNKRELYFSKKTFLKNIISNVEEVIASNKEDVYKNIKTAIRKRKDIYRDVIANEKNSKYYKEIQKEYKNMDITCSFENYLSLCKKKFTRLLSGYNTVLDLFDKPIDISKFINCFDENRLYLFTCYSILKQNKLEYELFSKINSNMEQLEIYKSFIERIRKENPFYNTHILLTNKIYTADELLKEYKEFGKDSDL